MTNRNLDDWNRWLDTFSRGENLEAWRGIMCFLRWIQVREENGHPVPSFLMGIEGDLFHSALLKRLLDGKEPLEHPPPESYGQGWYDLIETGRAITRDVIPWQWAPEAKIAINQDIWTILEKRSSDELIVTYRPEGEPYRLTKISESEWLLERHEGKLRTRS